MKQSDNFQSNRSFRDEQTIRSTNPIKTDLQKVIFSEKKATQRNFESEMITSEFQKQVFANRTSFINHVSSKELKTIKYESLASSEKNSNLETQSQSPILYLGKFKSFSIWNYETSVLESPKKFQKKDIFMKGLIRSKNDISREISSKDRPTENLIRSFLIGSNSISFISSDLSKSINREPDNSNPIQQNQSKFTNLKNKPLQNDFYSRLASFKTHNNLSISSILDEFDFVVESFKFCHDKTNINLKILHLKNKIPPKHVFSNFFCCVRKKNIKPEPLRKDISFFTFLYSLNSQSCRDFEQFSLFFRMASLTGNFFFNCLKNKKNLSEQKKHTLILKLNFDKFCHFFGQLHELSFFENIDLANSEIEKVNAFFLIFLFEFISRHREGIFDLCFWFGEIYHNFISIFHQFFEIFAPEFNLKVSRKGFLLGDLFFRSFQHYFDVTFFRFVKFLKTNLSHFPVLSLMNKTILEGLSDYKASKNVSSDLLLKELNLSFLSRVKC